MAAGDITITPVLLPWQQMGVDYLLAETDVPPEYSLCYTQKTAPKKVFEKAVAKRETHSSYIKPSVSVAAKAPIVPQVVASIQQQKVQQESKILEQQSSQQEYMPSSVDNAIIPPQQWPKQWQDCFYKIRSAYVLWTYWALGDDMGGAPNAERRALLQRFLKDLNHPSGTHAFWPVAMPVSQGESRELVFHNEIFWSGVRLLKARALVIFGEKATTALGLQASSKPFMTIRRQQYRIYILPDVDTLCAQPQRYDGICAFLQGQLDGFARKQLTLL